MVNHGRHKSRPVIESWLFNGTIVPWRQVIKAFQGNETVDRIGMFSSPAGWMWFNFWWARASYLQTVVEPVRTTRRHYYESWLGNLYEASTIGATEPGRFEDCSKCLSTVGPWGSRSVYHVNDISDISQIAKNGTALEVASQAGSV